MRSRLQWKRLMAARADELLVRSCFSLFGRAVEILISDDMSLPCDVNHPLWTDGSRWGDWENSGNRKREKLGRWRAGETVLPRLHALSFISSLCISSLSGRNAATEQIDAHHTAIALSAWFTSRRFGNSLLEWRCRPSSSENCFCSDGVWFQIV